LSSMARNSDFILPSSCGATPSFEMAWFTFSDLGPMLRFCNFFRRENT
jgi:hypothetical protein